MYKVFFLLVLLSAPVYGQFNLDDYVPVTVPEKVETVEVLEDIQEEMTAEPMVIPDIPLPFVEEDQKRIAEMNKILEDMKRLSAEVNAIVDEQKKAVKMTFEDSQISGLEERVATLERDSNNWVTREEVTEIVKAEVKKYVELTVQKGDTVKTVKAPMEITESAAVYNKVTIPGYAGTFDLAPGEVITHIDGVPVRQYSNSTDAQPIAYANNYFMRAVPRNNAWRVRFSQPSNCSQMADGTWVCN